MAAVLDEWKLQQLAKRIQVWNKSRKKLAFSHAGMKLIEEY
jgi:hypothetical protein